MKTVLITGSTDGIGKQTAIMLAQKGFFVLIHGRSGGKCKQTIEEISALTKNKNLDYFVYDLISLKEVLCFSNEVKKRYSNLDVLINNAGVYLNDYTLSPEGIEATFQINYLAMFFLTLNLIPIMKPKDNKTARIINVSSMAHSYEMDFENLIKPPKYDGHRAYDLSKLCVIYFTFELSEKLKDKNITVNCLHPGVINTKLLRAGWKGFGKLFSKNVGEGAITTVYLAISDEAENITGKYFSDTKTVKPRAAAYDIDSRKRLWRLSEELIWQNGYDLQKSNI
ncbi:MAG: SDR family oxidoreductase [Candidatus Acididesulfobacter diazotrophicus]|jgi:NAD(P)-dependent dehydrogenase (short-subunit alcohol dehydrogenase family)|uniref:SDR family oxidoreductase n=1 Tax=Candidatus Acididesulfobacter diazotrophicus TaxID=2597226 RepID=A0A519BKE5_9DELT|nr:MAG: SDR family oxidoreductase [Candidatus Acididesulfobacter diazotrophicus]